MKKINQFLTSIPTLLSSKLSIFIYLFIPIFLLSSFCGTDYVDTYIEKCATFC